MLFVNRQTVLSLDEIQNPLAWSVGLGPKKQREWLVDCYRMRLDDEYTVGGDVRGGSIYRSEHLLKSPKSTKG